MQEMNPHITGHGYIVIPKALLIEQFASCENREGEIEAFLKLLIKVNYTETKHTDYWHNTIMCKRGESLHSYRSWSVIFHWSTGKTYRFIQQLNAKGIIEIIPHDAATFLHIRVVNYESWTNALAFNPGKQQKKKSQRRKVPPLLGRLPQHHAAPQREHRQGAAYLEKAERKRTAARHRQYRRVLLSSDKREIHVTCLQLFIQ
ncbi:hypothetical protein ACMSDX_17225 [Bacteroides thetaiotaomicron]|uniref:hypothetical protein n=1 Tax=Bacteroides thetaiotaomicron TaxID=818 RepID=UPI0039C32AD5